MTQHTNTDFSIHCDADQALTRLTALINRHFKSEVTEEQVLTLFTHHWKAVSYYSHRVMTEPLANNTTIVV